MVFNYTTPTNISGFPEMGTYLNSVSDGFFGFMLMMTFSIVLFISFMRLPPAQNFMATSFLSFILAFILYLMDWIQFIVVIVYVFAIAASVMLNLRK